MFTFSQEALSNIRSTFNRYDISNFTHDYARGVLGDSHITDVRVMTGFTNIVSLILDIEGSELSENLNDIIQRSASAQDDNKSCYQITQLVINIPIKRTMQTKHDLNNQRKLVSYIDDEVMLTTGFMISKDGSAESCEHISTGLMYKDIEHYIPEILEGNVRLTVNGLYDSNLSGFELLDSRFNTDAYADVFLRNKSIGVNNESGLITACFYVFDGEYLDPITHSIDITLNQDKDIITLASNSDSYDSTTSQHNSNTIDSMRDIMLRIISNKVVDS